MLKLFSRAESTRSTSARFVMVKLISDTSQDAGLPLYAHTRQMTSCRACNAAACGCKRQRCSPPQWLRLRYGWQGRFARPAPPSCSCSCSKRTFPRQPYPGNCLFDTCCQASGIASPALDAGHWRAARPSPQSCCECRSSTAVRYSQPLCVRRTVMSMTHAFFYLFTSSGSCRIFDSGCADALRLRLQRLAGTALAFAVLRQID